jgi:phage-related protein
MSEGNGAEKKKARQTNKELLVMGRVERMLDELPQDAARRVLSYLLDKVQAGAYGGAATPIVDPRPRSLALNRMELPD